jgi:hypothetical protein
MKISPTVERPVLRPVLTVGKQRLAAWIAALVLLALHFSAAANASDPPGDIACGSTRYIVPGACMQQCKGRRTLANLNAGKCFLAPQTPELSGNQLLRQFYNQALFGAGPVPPPQSRVVLVAHILNLYYPPNKAPNFAINFGPTKEQFAGLTRASSPSQKPVLAISDDLFWLTPAFVVSTLGHEMIHMDQYQRKYKTNLNGINDAVAALRELEAYSWQLKKDNFPRTFKVGSLYSSFQNSEQQETELNFECAHWDVSNAIENIVTGPRSLIYSKSLAAWLEEDPWVRQVWLPQNPNWAQQHAGSKPAACH